MKKLTSLFPSFSIFCLLALLLVSSCVDQDFDTPPANGEDPDIPASAIISIKELKDMHQFGTINQLESDKYIVGLVTANDESGNFFQTIIMEDETAGILLLIEQSGLSNLYPVGRRLFVRLDDLYLSDFNGLIQLAGQVSDTDGDGVVDRVDGIEEVLVDEIVLRGQFGLEVIPTVVNLGELNDDKIGSLIQLENVQFIDSDAGETYADAAGQRSVNRTIETCDGGSIIVRSSGFANFANQLTPEGNGTLTAVYTIFGTTKQLVIRDTSDVNFGGDRCGGGTPGGTEISIGDLRNLYNGAATNAPAGSKIIGTVISDRANGNIDGRNLIIQNGNRGITVRFQDEHEYDLNDVLEISTSGSELSDFNGLVQVSGVPIENASVTGSNSISPMTVTVADFLAQSDALESVLLKFEDVMLTGDGGTTYNGNVTVSDATGTVAMFTRGAATFSGATLPEMEVDLVAVGSQFNDPQIFIRNLDDVDGEVVVNPGGDIDEDFQSSVTNNADVDITGWNNLAIQGTRLWRGREFDGNFYVQATAFNDTEANMETWLITPEVDLSSPKTLTFESAQAFYVHDGLTVWIATDYDGTNADTANWTQLSANFAQSTDQQYEFQPSGNVDLSAFSGTGHIGFRYQGSGPLGNTTTWLLDNVKVD